MRLAGKFSFFQSQEVVNQQSGVVFLKSLLIIRFRKLWSRQATPILASLLGTILVIIFSLIIIVIFLVIVLRQT